ncbi:FMN-dependent alpha-hydroxy acid dehydrogenase [Blastomyces gilchristii SLH14081]|uniref:FMN-dependent alpha-hydroxy acid dehydrogenase n=1 Tax=Blastomyces gilchristii (strain SLH14081) TaxID=559298 RepID=A0A179UB02_BLAGS|nr:FMN-dependent alpha-hydroxy acid dehydrogenase [Blastomyces gilchristii SLH14081]OAT04337.1 FMN-dependent alpha-hydroxy acid dehydrogenase [Blastomyces gilchristii SLH14081]
MQESGLKTTPAEESRNDQQKEDPITIAELAILAQKKLPKQVWDYYASGADEENALRRNRSAFDRLLLRPRVFRDVSHVDTSTIIFGKKYRIPIGISPSAMQQLVGGNGEIDMARAAASRGTTMILSSHTTCTLEDVIQAPGGGNPNRERCAQVISRFQGNRINERKTPLVLPPHLSLANLHQKRNNSTTKVKPLKAQPTMNRILLEARTAQEAAEITRGNHDTLNDASLTWSDTMSWLRSKTNLKIILKGIMTAEDALLAIEHGANAIIMEAANWTLSLPLSK